MNQQPLEPWEELTFDRTFWLTFIQPPALHQLLKTFCRALHGLAATEILDVTPQLNLLDHPKNKISIPDIAVDLTENRKVIVEMQNRFHAGIGKRIRLAKASIDRLDSGENFTDLPELFILYLCGFDLFKLGALRYESSSIFPGVDPEVFQDRFAEGEYTTVINLTGSPSSTEQVVDAEANELAAFIAHPSPSAKLKYPGNIAVKECWLSVIQNPDTRKVLKMLFNRDDVIRAEGKAEGKAEGIVEGIVEGQNRFTNLFTELSQRLLADGKNRDIVFDAMEDKTLLQNLAAKYGLTALLS